MTRPFAGPADVTRAGERHTEWEYTDADGHTYRLLARRSGIWLRDESYDTGIELFEEDLGPLAAMLAAAQQYLTGGQR